MKKNLILTALVLVVLFGSLFGFDYYRRVRSMEAFAHYRPAPVQVAATKAVLQVIPRTLAGIGTLEAVRQVSIAPEVAGRITDLHFEPGAKVRAGQPLLQLNDAPERGDLQKLHAQEKLAQVNLNRAVQLLAITAIAQSELEAKQAALDEVKADIAKTQALIDQKLIRAPFSGVLGVRQVHLGQYLNPGEAIVTLTDLSELYVDVSLPEQNSGVLKVGQTVNLTVDAQPQHPFSARVVAIEPQVGVGTRSIKLQAQIDNKEHLLTPGMFANATLVLPAAAKVITVPEIAVDYTIHGDSVYVVHKGSGQGGDTALTATRALIKTGARVGDRIEIQTGLREGDLVVTIGQLKLQDGAVVALVDDKTLRDAEVKQRGLLQ